MSLLWILALLFQPVTEEPESGFGNNPATKAVSSKVDAVMGLRTREEPAIRVTLRSGHEDWHVNALYRYRSGKELVLDSRAESPTSGRPGTLDLNHCRFTRRDETGGKSFLMHSWKSKKLELKEGETTVTLGPPFEMEMTASLVSENPVHARITDVRLVGAGGEIYRARAYGEPDSTLTSFIRSGEEERKTGDMAYG